MKHVAIVGASIAGWSAASALRAHGFDGRITVIGAEAHRPYDRPPLSKAFLAGTATRPDLDLEPDDGLDVDWRLGVPATGLDAHSSSLELDDGRSVVADGIVLATGAVPRNPWPDAPAGVHVLRTVDDAEALRADLTPGARLVVVGDGFIGAEVASTARALGLDVTIVGDTSGLLSTALGEAMGAAVAGLHHDHGVAVRAGVGVTAVRGTDRVTGVELADGTVIAADVAAVCVGVRPATAWLDRSGLTGPLGVVADAAGVTAVPTVVAVGDCASWYDPVAGEHQRFEHWTSAREGAAIAVAALLSGGTDRRKARPPYFWSDQHGRTITMAGRPGLADTVAVEAGDLDAREFLAVYRRAGTPVAVLAIGHTAEFARWRKTLATQITEPA